MKNKALSFVLAIVTVLMAVNSLASDEQISAVETYPAWADEAIKYAMSEGIMNGMENGFQPDTHMSRAMVVTVLYRYVGEPTNKFWYENAFSDIEKGTWYYSAVLWASQNGVVNGKGNGVFDPNGNVTRQEFITILHRFADKVMSQSVEYGRSTLSVFGDSVSIAPWAREAVLWACADYDDYPDIHMGKDTIIMGFPSTPKPLFKPDNALSRAEFAVMIHRYACSDIPTKREVLKQTTPEPKYTYVGREEELEGETYGLTRRVNWEGTGEFVLGDPVGVATDVVSGHQIFSPEKASAGIEIIHSYDELQVYLSEAKPEINGNLPCAYMHGYTEDYFDDKVLVVINRTFGSGGLDFVFTEAVRSGEELSLVMRTELRGSGLRPAIMAYAWQTYEMDRSALSGVKTISLYAVSDGFYA